jgi:hypothetical protein
MKRRKFRQIIPNGDSAAGQVRATGLQPANRSVDISALCRALRDGRNGTRFISFAAVFSSMASRMPAAFHAGGAESPISEKLSANPDISHLERFPFKWTIT